jgi:hypothetical protein
MLATMVGVCVLLDSNVEALQAESQTDKETNFKRQALGGLFNQWTFDQQRPDETPSGFSPMDLGEGPAAVWQVALDAEAPTKPNVLRGSSSCQQSSCYRLIVADKFEYEYPDVTVRLQLPNQAVAGVGGVVLNTRGDSCGRREGVGLRPSRDQTEGSGMAYASSSTQYDYQQGLYGDLF